MSHCHTEHQVVKPQVGEVGSIYTCPMHPEVRQEKPGMCPECGMNLVPAKPSSAKATEGRHAGHSTNIFKIKFWVSLALTVPVVYFAIKTENKIVPAVLGSVVFFYGGWVFLKSALVELRARLPGMMTLIAIAILASYFWSIYAVAVGETPLFWELTTLITIMLLGHWLEMKAVSGASGALKELSKLIPDTAEVVGRGVVKVAELKVGDVVLVKPGARIPVDGTVVEGTSSVNESMITGESRPVEKKIGSETIAGTINGDGSLQIRVDKIGEATFLAGVMRLVAQAQASKSRMQILADRAALYLTIAALSVGGISFVIWLFARAGVAFAVERLVAVLVIACPHALGLAVPLVASISTTKGAQNGILVKERLALEAARNIDVVLFDKTGTLTTGEFGVIDVKHRVFNTGTLGVGNESDVLRMAASVEAHSEHPIASAIVGEAKKRGLKIAEAKNFQRVPGQGARAEIENKKVFVGWHETSDVENVKHRMSNIVVEVDGQIVGEIEVADTVRPESRQAIEELKKMGIKTAMITGDSDEVAKSVAQQIGIDEYFARVLPEEKSEKVRELQSRGLKVAMVGDGVNDAPALTQADLGIAVGAGTNVAIESAGIILIKSDPRDIVKVIKLSRATYAKMVQNLWWASGYNIITIPLAAGVLTWAGVTLQPAFSAALMSVSTVVVAFNALLLKRKEL